jgi:hypothetical protein
MIVLMPLTPTPSPPREIAAGAWGGTGIAMTVEESGAKIELDCAHGRISRRLALDAEGRFELPGTLARERPGPVRMGPGGEPAEEKGVPATYAGRLDGGILHLTIRVEKAEEPGAELRLQRGATPRLHKCL